MTHSHLCHVHLWHDSFKCGTWLAFIHT